MIMKLILASASPRRREILSNIGTDFDILVPEFDERKFIENELLRGDISPQKQTVLLAREKAKRSYALVDNPENIAVLGVDTSVITDGIVLGKPKDEDDAVNMLMMLSGKCHRVVSGYAVVTSNGEEILDYDETFVYMRNFTESEARRYVKSEYVLDKAGAYAIQGRAAVFIEKIDGCYFNVVGLPIYKIANALNKLGFEFI